MSFSEEAPFPTLSLTLDKLPTSNVWKSPSQNKYTSSSQDHFPIAITSSHKHYYAPCSAYLDRAPGTTLPRAAGSSSSGGYQDRGSQDSTFPPQCYSCWAWAGGAGTRLTVLAESRVHWLGSRVAQGKGYAGTLHTALTVHLLSWTHGLPYARDTGHDKLCTTSAVTLKLPWCARLGRDTLQHHQSIIKLYVFNPYDSLVKFLTCASSFPWNVLFLLWETWPEKILMLPPTTLPELGKCT